MRWIVNMFKARLKSALLQPFSWMFVVAAVIVSLIPVFVGTQADSRLSVAVVTEDEGTLHEKLITLLEDNKELTVTALPRSEAMRLLAMDRMDAVFVIKNNYTNTLQHADFRDTVELFTSPSSAVSATISAPIINGTIMLWIEEAAIARTRAFLSAHGYTYSAADEKSQRAQIKATWENGAPFTVRTFIAQTKRTDEVDSFIPLAACARWYGAFAVFYIIVSAGYVLDISKKSLALRVRSTGARMGQLLVGASLAPLILCMAGCLFALTLCALLTGAPYFAVLGLLAPMLLYFGAVMGATLLLSSMLRHTIALMLLAPIATFINAVLGGLLVTLPDWAAVLEALSSLLPGRALHGAIAAAMKGIAMPLGLVVCCGVYLLIGLCAASLRSTAKESE